MLTRPLTNGTTYLGQSESDAIARQWAGNERLATPDLVYFSGPGTVAAVPAIPHPDGGNAIAPGGAPTGSNFQSWRTW